MTGEFRKPNNEPRDFSKRKDKDVNSDGIPLSPETHRSIVRSVLSITNNHYSFDLTAGELGDFADAVDSGKLEIEAVVGKEVTTKIALGKGPYSSFILIDVFNESFGVSDLPQGEKEIALVAILIDHTNDAPPNRSANLNIGIKADGRIAYNFFSSDKSDAEQTKLIEDEVLRWGLRVQLSNEQTTKMEGIFNENQGGKLLQALREIDEG